MNKFYIFVNYNSKYFILYDAILNKIALKIFSFEVFIAIAQK